MAWKNDLAKLKQELKQEDPAPPKAPPRPKAAPATAVSQSIEEEDAIFLNAMGLRPQARPKEPPVAQPAPAALVRAEPADAGTAPEAFATAMDDLKGMKPLRHHPAEDSQAPKPAPNPGPQSISGTRPAPSTRQSAPAAPSTRQAMPAQPVAVAAEPPPPPPAPAPEPKMEGAPIVTAEGQPSALEIHLAAGMAIEVDGRLDLRGHARFDGEERLKERVLDGYALGWRTLHVNLGPAPELREMLLAMLTSPEGRCVTRYAQAPIPMGGSQAWILYFRPSTTPAPDTI